MDREEFQKSVASLLDQPISFCLKKEEEHSLYLSAFSLYEKKEYRKSSSVFTRLVLINPFFPAYWKGLAASKQMSSEYEQALQAWALATLLDTEDPMTHLHAAECLSRIDDRKEAQKALDSAARLLPETNERLEKIRKELYDCN